MAKNKPTNRKSTLLVKLTNNKRDAAGVVLILVLIVVATSLFISSRQDPTTKVTSTRELAKSSVNLKNTKETKASTPTTANAPSGSTSSPTTTKKTTTTKSNPTASTPASSGGSSSASPTSPSTPAVAFRIEDAPYTDADNSYEEIGCSQTARFTFTSNLTATAAGTATYHWERSDGAQSSDRQIVFTAAGTQQVTNTWDLSSDSTPGIYEVTGWQKMVVTSPNETNSKPSDAAFTLAINCM